MSNDVEVSVVVPFHGDPEPTLDLVRALRRQRGAAVQIIVSDDCSPVPFPDGDGYEVVRREANGGFGAAVNSGAARARHPHLMILNSDLSIGDDFVADMVEATAPWWPTLASPTVREGGGLNAVPMRWPRNRTHVVEWLVPLAAWHHTTWMARLLGHDVDALASDDVTPVDWVVGAALLVPTDDFRALGGFDESFFMNSEEIDLQRRLRDRGVGSVYVPGVEVGHVGGGSSDPTRRVRWVVRSWFRYARKWGRPGALYAGLMTATLVNGLWNAARATRDRSVHPWRTLVEQRSTVVEGWRTSRD